MTGLDLSVGEELSRSFEPCLNNIMRQQTVGRDNAASQDNAATDRRARFIAAIADLSAPGA